VNVKGALDLKGGRGSDIDLQSIDGQVTIAGSYNGIVQFRDLKQALRMSGGMGLDLSIERIPGQVRMVLGDFTASNLVGPIHLSCPSRDVRISDFTNSLELSVARGDIELRPGTLPLARMDVHTHSGDITLSLPPAAKFDLTASTSRGDVTNDFGSPITTENSGRGATLRGSMPGSPRVSVQTDRGEVTVRKASADDKPSTSKSSDPATALKKLDQ